MGLSREPARPHDPGYPTFSEFDPGRRAALRAIALAGLSAAGLQLVGCPGGGSGAPPAGTGTGPATDAVPPTDTAPPTDTGTGPATDTGPPTDTDWVPWRDPATETGPAEPMRPGGAVAPRPFDLPVAIVVGGGPIDVVFSDGRKARLAVALVVQPGTTPGGIKADAPEHVAAVKAAAKALPGAVLDDAAGLETLGARIQDEVRRATPGLVLELVLEGVQAAPVQEPAPPGAPRASAPPPAAAPSAGVAPSAGAVAPSAPAVARPARAPLTGSRVWVPCGKPGCTACGAK